MKIASRMIMKHSMHRTRDLKIEYMVNLIKRTVTMHVDSIDTLLIQRFLELPLLDAINRELENVGKLPLLTNVNGFAIELVVDEKTRFNLQLVERDFEPREATLVMKLK